MKSTNCVKFDTRDNFPLKVGELLRGCHGGCHAHFVNVFKHLRESVTTVTTFPGAHPLLVFSLRVSLRKVVTVVTDSRKCLNTLTKWA